LAETKDDLQVIASLLHDAVSRVGDIRHDSRARTVLITMNRFCWEKARFSPPARSRTALQINGVLSIKAKGIAQGRANGVLSLLDIEFTPKEKPGGKLVLTFADGGAVALEVEMLDVALVDISGPWGAKSRPRHGR